MNPQTSIKIFKKKILILEIISVLEVYILYCKMDPSEDFRHKMKQIWPSILELYYKSNDWASIYGIRETDEEKWLTKTS